LPSSLAAPSMMRAEVKYSPVPPEPSTEARSRTLLIIGPPGSRTNVVPDEAPPNKPLKQTAAARRDQHRLPLARGEVPRALVATCHLLVY
jgi:hypothetical protein